MGVAVVALVFGWVPWYLAGLATQRRFVYQDRENAGLTPASFGLTFEDVSFRAGDGVPLSAWWVQAPDAHGTIVMAHGLNRSRVEMVRRIPFANRRGWNALALDLRHHGQSGGGATTFGAKEKDDVAAGVAFARSRGAGPVVLWGVSLGAASALLAAASDPTVAGVIVDSSYRSLDDTVRHHLELFRRFRLWLRLVPVWPVADEAVFWMGRRGGFDPAEVNLRAAAARLAGRPALFVANSHDRRMPSEIAFELQKAAGPRAQVLIVPGQSHGGAWRDGTVAYENAVAALLDVAGPPPGNAGRAGTS